MGKEAITITIDTHLHQWIKDQGGNKSRAVNKILMNAWINREGYSSSWREKIVKKAKLYQIRPGTPSSNGVHYLTNCREDQLMNYLGSGLTLHDSKFPLDEQKTLIWDFDTYEINYKGEIIDDITPNAEEE